MADITVAWSNEREKWVVMDGNTAVSTHPLKHSAEKEGRRYAKSKSPSTLRIENKAGRVSYMQEYA